MYPGLLLKENFIGGSWDGRKDWRMAMLSEDEKKCNQFETAIPCWARAVKVEELISNWWATQES
jgi:hypothetical protein